jgi:hypothetical protein
LQTLGFYSNDVISRCPILKIDKEAIVGRKKRKHIPDATIIFSSAAFGDSDK